MKKEILFYIFILFISIIFITAQNPQDPSSLISGVEFDSHTGLPKSFGEFEKKIDSYQDREQNQSYFQKEWGILLGKTPVIGPLLFYTERFFSFFNFLWTGIFGIEFSWNLLFFTHLFLWGVLIFVIYFPAREIFNNKLFGFITGFVVASLTGIFKGILIFAQLLETSLRTFFSFGIAFILLLVLLFIYQRLFASLSKSQEEELLERSKQQTIGLGKIIGDFFRRN